jgi:hypothetical protein
MIVEFSTENYPPTLKDLQSQNSVISRQPLTPFESRFDFPDRLNLSKLTKAENVSPRELATAILNHHLIAFQGLLRLESRKSQQRLDLFHLNFIFLDEAGS